MERTRPIFVTPSVPRPVLEGPTPRAKLRRWGRPGRRSRRKEEEEESVDVVSERSYSYPTPSSEKSRLTYGRRGTSTTRRKPSTSVSYQMFSLGSGENTTTTTSKVEGSTKSRDEDSYGIPLADAIGTEEQQQERPPGGSYREMSDARNEGSLPLEALFQTATPFPGGYARGVPSPEPLVPHRSRQNPFLSRTNPKTEEPKFIPVMVMVPNPAFMPRGNSPSSSYSPPPSSSPSSDLTPPTTSYSPPRSSSHSPSTSSSPPTPSTTYSPPETSYSSPTESRPPSTTTASSAATASYSPPESLPPETTSYSPGGGETDTPASRPQAPPFPRTSTNVVPPSPQGPDDDYGAPRAPVLGSQASTGSGASVGNAAPNRNPFLTEAPAASTSTSTSTSTSATGTSTSIGTTSYSAPDEIPSYSPPANSFPKTSQGRVAGEESPISSVYRAPTSSTPSFRSQSSPSRGATNAAATTTGGRPVTPGQKMVKDGGGASVSVKRGDGDSPDVFRVKLSNSDEGGGGGSGPNSGVEQSINLNINVIVKGNKDDSGSSGPLMPTVTRRKVQTITQSRGGGGAVAPKPPAATRASTTGTTSGTSSSTRTSSSHPDIASKALPGRNFPLPKVPAKVPASMGSRQPATNYRSPDITTTRRPATATIATTATTTPAPTTPSPSPIPTYQNNIPMPVAPQLTTTYAPPTSTVNGGFQSTTAGPSFSVLGGQDPRPQRPSPSQRPQYVVRKRKRPRKKLRKKKPSITFQDEAGHFRPMGIKHSGTPGPPRYYNRPTATTPANPNKQRSPTPPPGRAGRYRAPTSPAQNVLSNYRRPPPPPAPLAPIQPTRLANPIPPPSPSSYQAAPPAPGTGGRYTSTTLPPPVPTTTTTTGTTASPTPPPLPAYGGDPSSVIRTPQEYEAPDVVLDEYYSDGFEDYYAYDYDDADIYQLYTYEEDDEAYNSVTLPDKGGGIWTGTRGNSRRPTSQGNYDNNSSPPPPTSTTAVKKPFDGRHRQREKSERPPASSTRGQGQAPLLPLPGGAVPPSYHEEADSYGTPLSDPVVTRRPHYPVSPSYATVRTPSFSFTTTHQPPKASPRPTLLPKLLSQLRHPATQVPPPPPPPRPKYLPPPLPPSPSPPHLRPGPSYLPPFLPSTTKSPSFFRLNKDLIPDLEEVAKYSDWNVMDFRDWAKVITPEPHNPRRYHHGKTPHDLNRPFPKLGNPFEKEMPDLSLVDAVTTTFDELIRYRQPRQYLPVALLQERVDGDQGDAHEFEVDGGDGVLDDAADYADGANAHTKVGEVEKLVVGKNERKKKSPPVAKFDIGFEDWLQKFGVRKERIEGRNDAETKVAEELLKNPRKRREAPVKG